MSSHDADIDVDVDVVSSPEPSPRGNTSDDEGRNECHRFQMRSSSIHSPISTSPTAHSIAATLLTTSAANLSPSSFHSLHNHSAQLLSSQYHNHLSNSLLNISNNNNNSHISAESTRLSPPKTPPETNNNTISNKTTTPTTPGYTSFSISNILSRNDSPTTKKGQIITPLPTLPLNCNGPQDAAMLSR